MLQQLTDGLVALLQGRPCPRVTIRGEQRQQLHALLEEPPPRTEKGAEHRLLNDPQEWRDVLVLPNHLMQIPSSRSRYLRIVFKIARTGPEDKRTELTPPFVRPQLQDAPSDAPLQRLLERPHLAIHTTLHLPYARHLSAEEAAHGGASSSSP